MVDRNPQKDLTISQLQYLEKKGKKSPEYCFESQYSNFGKNWIPCLGNTNKRNRWRKLQNYDWWTLLLGESFRLSGWFHQSLSKWKREHHPKNPKRRRRGGKPHRNVLQMDLRVQKSKWPHGKSDRHLQRRGNFRTSVGQSKAWSESSQKGHCKVQHWFCVCGGMQERKHSILPKKGWIHEPTPRNSLPWKLTQWWRLWVLSSSS